ncbi:MAG: GntR family transcriptional regulator [Sphaerochaetaceae bacterium]|nr:GntR family transcriptional regulator [Sphaerochaetaceae bacterium]MDC7237290.1 GntR family transcriptional regulator [Sphaerochaetaceae bacterium]MDC7250622.1 GntR family transcriptional regulator [Sphaerochaetaceae bacterium]
MGEFIDSATLIFETLKKEILSLEIKPGESVVEADICKRFSASRTPVRTAFHRLSDAGLLETVRYKGSRAPLINKKIVEQLIFMRISIEEKVLQEYIDIYDQFSIADCYNCLKKQELSLEIGDFSITQFYQDDAKFHKIWFDRCDKEYLWLLLQDLSIDYTRFKTLDIVTKEHCGEILSEHRLMLEAIDKKDKKEIIKLINKHLNGGVRRLSSMMETEYASYFIQ